MVEGNLRKNKKIADADIREAITIESMPPYSPDLNPIEQVWR